MFHWSNYGFIKQIINQEKKVAGTKYRRIISNLVVKPIRSIVLQTLYAPNVQKLIFQGTS
jgi:hypothetical protein